MAVQFNYDGQWPFSASLLVPGTSTFSFRPADLDVVAFPQTIYSCQCSLLSPTFGRIVCNGNFSGGSFSGSILNMFPEGIVSPSIIITGPIVITYTDITYNSARLHWNNADYSTLLQLYFLYTGRTINLPLTTTGSYLITGLTPSTTYYTGMETQWGPSNTNFKHSGEFTTLARPRISPSITWFFSP
jgi:hypothetical protein